MDPVIAELTATPVRAFLAGLAELSPASRNGLGLNVASALCARSTRRPANSDLEDSHLPADQ
ncbi:hypothetical protein [Nonomuraea indica]|uniref:FXSXX-COOH protein n=1 Tax=Nonomuraea indica TaxID=1581193 RepID=A0ABW8A8S8_9ACTN